MLNRIGFRGVAPAVLGILLSIACSGCTTTPQPSPSASPQSQPPAAREPVHVAPQAAPVSCAATFPYYPPPDRLDLCGEPVPLQHESVRERFDREFTTVVYNHAQVYLWLKRMDRYFPQIEERLKSMGLPDDLKYVAIVESDLVPNVVSPKGAAGPWQFMPATGSAYGLHQQGSIDKRYDFERSTISAFRYLSDLNRKYNNWALAIAAYNCGEKRILDESRAQGTRDYYHLKLPSETERYVMRILAVKAVLGNPTRYGYCLPKGMGYGELKVDRVTMNLSCSTPIHTVAACAGTTYREFKRLNPEFRADVIPSGCHEVKFPAGCGPAFEQNFSASRASVSSSVPEPSSDEAPREPAQVRQPKPSPLKAKSRQPAETFHTVRKGDTLFSIARHYRVNAQDIKKANRLRGNDIVPGQKLKIP